MYPSPAPVDAKIGSSTIGFLLLVVLGFSEFEVCILQAKAGLRQMRHAAVLTADEAWKITVPNSKRCQEPFLAKLNELVPDTFVSL